MLLAWLVAWAAAGELQPSVATSMTGRTGAVSPGFVAFSPALRLAVRPRLMWRGLAASWGVFRDQRFCDTCSDEDGYRPGNGGGAQLVGSDDLSLTATKAWDQPIWVTVGVELPASRASLACNPRYGAASIRVRAGELNGPFASLGASADAYQHAAAPVGLCSRPLSGVSVEPTPWTGTRFVGANPDFAGVASIGWTGQWGRSWRGTATASLTSTHMRGTGSSTVQTLSGPVVVDTAARPFIVNVPLSGSFGAAVSESTRLSGSLGVSLPVLTADATRALRSLPGSAAVGVHLTTQL